MDRLEEIDADKALYRLSLYGGDIQELAEVVEAEVEKLRYATPLTLTDLEVDMVEANSYQRRHRKRLIHDALWWMRDARSWNLTATFEEARAEKAEADREKLIGALEEIIFLKLRENNFPDKTSAVVQEMVNEARAVLKEVRND